MRKRRICLLLIVIGVIACAVVFGVRREPEPEYGGKRLSYYVEFLGSGSVGGRLRRAGMDSTSVDAINQIGSNAVPFLLEWLEYDQPVWKANLYGAVNSKLGWDLFDKREARADGAAIAFSILGRKAHGAIPGVTRLIDRSSSVTAQRAVFALHCLGDGRRPGVTFGTNIVPSLIEILKAADPDLRNAASNRLRAIDPEALEKATAR